MRPQRTTHSRLAMALFAPAIALGVLWSPAALAGPFGGHGGPGGWRHADMEPEERAAHMSERITEAVNGTEQQRQQVEDLVLDLAPRMKDIALDGRDLRADFADAFVAETIDAEEVETLRQRFVGLADRASSVFSEGFVAMGDIFTVEQRTRMVEMRKQMRRWRTDR